MNRWFLDENDIDIYLKCTDDVRWHYNKKELVRILNDLEAKLAEKEKEIERLLIARELLLSDLHYARMDCEKTNRQIREFDKSCGDIINNLITQIEQTNETKRLKENK